MRLFYQAITPVLQTYKFVSYSNTMVHPHNIRRLIVFNYETKMQ